MEVELDNGMQFVFMCGHISNKAFKRYNRSTCSPVCLICGAALSHKLATCSMCGKRFKAHKRSNTRVKYCADPITNCSVKAKNKKSLECYYRNKVHRERQPLGNSIYYKKSKPVPVRTVKRPVNKTEYTEPLFYVPQTVKQLLDRIILNA